MQGIGNWYRDHRPIWDIETVSGQDTPFPRWSVLPLRGKIITLPPSPLKLERDRLTQRLNETQSAIDKMTRRITELRHTRHWTAIIIEGRRKLLTQYADRSALHRDYYTRLLEGGEKNHAQVQLLIKQKMKKTRRYKKLLKKIKTQLFWVGIAA